MSESFTARLGLNKPNPGTGELVDVAEYAANMDKIDAAMNATEVTSTTRPAVPFANQIIRESDTKKVFIWNAPDGTWDEIPTSVGFNAAWDARYTASVAGTTTDQTFTANGTWNKPAGVKRILVRMVGAGGAGGGAPSTAAGTHSKGGGGGGGEYAERMYNASELGASNAVTVGAGGVGVSGGVGGNGGASSFGASFAANGGIGGDRAAAASSAFGVIGGDGGAGGTGTADMRSGGQAGGPGWGQAAQGCGGVGGSSVLGGGGLGQTNPSGSAISTAGGDASGWGGGGGGAHSQAGGSAVRGGHGKSGVVIVTNYF